MPVVGDDEAVEIEVEAVLDGGAVDLGDQPAGAAERRARRLSPFMPCWTTTHWPLSATMKPCR
jgi:hypothetical protein